MSNVYSIIQEDWMGVSLGVLGLLGMAVSARVKATPSVRLGCQLYPCPGHGFPRHQRRIGMR